MNLMQILNIIACVIYLELTVLVLYGKRYKDPLNRSLSLFLGCFFLWALGLSFIESPYSSKETATFWFNGYAVSWIGFCSAFLYFTFVFTQGKIIKKWLYIPLIGLPAFFLYVQYAYGIAVVHAQKQPYGWTYEWVDSGWRYLYYLYFVSFSATAAYLLFKFKKRSRNRLKIKQAGIIIKVFVISLVIGSATDVVLPEMRFFSMPPVVPITTLIWAFGMVYAIVRYKFLEVNSAYASEQIIDTISECLILTDSEGKIISSNSATECLLGWKKDELLSMHVQHLFPEEYYNIIIAQRIKNEQGLRNQDALLVTKEHKLVDVMLSYAFLKGLKAETIGVVYIARDISERKKMEGQLKRLAAVVQHSMELVALATVDGNGIFINEAGSKMLGINPEEVGQHHMMEVITEPYKEIAYKELLPALLKGNTWEGDLQYRNLKTGALIDVHTMAFGIKDSTSPVVSFLVTISLDITESKRMQDKLKEQVAFTEAVINSLPGVFYLFDQQGKFLRWNRNLAIVTGYSPEEIAKMNPLDFFDGDDKQKIEEAVKVVLKQGQVSVAANFLTKDGKKIPYLFSGQKIFLGGKDLLAGMGLDISISRE